ncbi:ABC-2 type transport system ATP-binding protein [Breznakia sp. PF5-3]|uniref:ABC transporter ATP-binding protein n=1 Tax=unclassified Breznakia TaxID=2623764 RepID=UPI0024064803|nr:MULTISPECIES: ABC transporter ATP-binding protein [unclassified Breznakia]MDL2276200.1 ABC transporter ATP-binding protein [Breznakia sp. OttesenSCG-928-G09]MDF9824721.1 ABC-2 type transport system ATP-binding protein [Breznakia sp. PM6-1]MDF9835384.1 ABC-2 type transport system ATP-binding protein [Breznakia sp. PF5-3]MDF9836983.1 ABC-2 type transport system ATP-binding protein [Breznakia sp. PFB2-8]MDF9859619.1 ABC-2 type transport system ATP-binding protein [Breznakia sp. PH5-24]
MEVIAKIDNVTKSYGKKEALSNVTFDVHPGEIIGLLGPNGSGKTTLIKILNSLIADYSGNIEIDGHSIGVHSKSVISYLPDEPYFEGWQKGTDVLEIFIDMYKDFDYDRCIRLLERFQIDPVMRFKEMSKGMKEKFLLALVMSRNAKVIILDEPIGGVDPAAREIILDTILENYSEEQTIIMSTHLIADIERIFNRVIFLKEGSVVLDDDVESIRMQTGKSIDELFREEFR